MPRFIVTVEYTQYTQSCEIGVWARDEEDACDKAESIVSKWNGVINAEATDCEEE